MKKLFLILFTLMTSASNFHAMENQVTNQTGFAYGIPLFPHDITNQNGPFYDQNQVDCKAQIKGAQDIIEQHNVLHDVYAQMQSHKIKNNNELIAQITAVYDKAQQEPSGIKAYDPLIQNQDIVKYANMYQPISLEKTPTYNLILLAQEYIASEYALSPTQKLLLWNKINPLLSTQPLIWHELSQYNPQTIEAFSSFLPIIYDKIWNNHKFIITSRLLQTLNTVKSQQGFLTSQFNDINQMRSTLNNQAAKYDNALVIINSKIAPAVSTENVTPHNESMQTKLIEIATQITTIARTEVEPVIENIQVTLQPQSAEAAEVSKQIIEINAPKKALPLSKKQLTALAVAEKKAEQSRIDKERHRLALEQKKAEDVTKLTTLPIATVISKNNSSKTIQKKLSPKKSEPKADDDFDMILNQAIAENNKKIIQTNITELDKAITQQINSNAITMVKTSTDSIIKQSVELINYLEFIEARNVEYLQLQQAKELQRKENFKKVLRTKPHDRERVKSELEAALHNDFSIVTKSEKEIILLLNAYAYAIDIKNINATSLEDFKSIESKIIAAENYLQRQGTHLNWYLAAYPDLYSLIKSKYIKFKAIMQKTFDEQEKFLQNEYAKNPVLTEIEKKIMRKDLNALSPLHKQEAILKSLTKTHTNNGVLDISRLIYPMKTQQELDQLGTLDMIILQRAQEDIKILCTNTKTIHYSLIQPIVDNLLQQADITTPPQGLVEDMIRMSSSIAQSKNNKDKLFTDFSSKLFSALQRTNEMSLIPLTNDQMADINKIHMAVLSALVDIEQARS